MTFAILPHILVIFTSFIGVILTIYIYHKKQAKEAMVCPLNGHCETVVNSEFSKFLGIRVELLGMLYYSAVALSYAFFAIIPETNSPLFTTSVFLASASAFLFSGYLIFIQAFYLKQWCTWCLGSAGISTIIFLLSLFTSGGTAMAFLGSYGDVFISLYAIGLAIGVGGSTVTAIFLAKFLKDLHISRLEAEIMRTMSQITWVGLATIVLSGFSLYFPPAIQAASRLLSPMQILLTIIIVIASAFLDLLVSPRLITISLRQEHTHQQGELHFLRKVAYMLISITLATWYTAFIIRTLPETWEPNTTAIFYISFLVIAIIASQVFERLSKKTLPEI